MDYLLTYFLPPFDRLRPKASFTSLELIWTDLIRTSRNSYTKALKYVKMRTISVHVTTYFALIGCWYCNKLGRLVLLNTCLSMVLFTLQFANSSSCDVNVPIVCTISELKFSIVYVKLNGSSTVFTLYNRGLQLAVWTVQSYEHSRFYNRLGKLYKWAQPSISAWAVQPGRLWRH